MKRLISILSALSMAASVCAIPAAAEETTAAPIMMTAMTSTTTATFPPVAGTIVTTGTTAESESTTTTTSPFPEVDGDQKALFTDKIWVYDGSTNDPVGGIDVQYVEYDADPSKDPDAQIVRVLAEWNTAQVNPAAVNVYEYTEGHFYGVEIPQLPEGYSHEGDGFVSGYGLHNRTGDSLFGIQLPVSLQPWDPLPEVASYPVEDTVEVRFQLEDGLTGEPITGVEMECVDSEGQPVTENWITGMDPHAIRCPVYLSDARSGAAYYFRIADGETLPTPFRKDAYERLDSLHCGGVGINESTYRMILRDGFYEYTFMLYPEDLHTEDPQTSTTLDAAATEPAIETPACTEVTGTTAAAAEKPTMYVIKLPDKTVYAPGEALDLTGGKVFLRSWDNEMVVSGGKEGYCYEAVVDMTTFRQDTYILKTDYNADVPGEYTVTLLFQDWHWPVSPSFTVTVTGDGTTTAADTQNTEISSDTETTTVAETSAEESLPQSGMPWAKPLTGLAALLSVTGAAFVLKSRK
ncbi:MAG: hypothetical protein IJV58_02355 [Oscillospiraceae bacterium]|nr:hypothetical protein [Oscillospiraceae bacterium]